MKLIKTIVKNLPLLQENLSLTLLIESLSQGDEGKPIFSWLMTLSSLESRSLSVLSATYMIAASMQKTCSNAALNLDLTLTI